MNHISTRLATLGDLDVVASLFNAYRQFYEQQSNLPLAKEFIRERLEKQQSLVIIATNENGGIVGFSQLYPTFCSVIAAAIYTLSDLFVAPQARKTGAGRALLMASEALGRENGVARLDLTTAKTNLTAQSLYESVGWVRDEIFFAYNKAVAG